MHAWMNPCTSTHQHAYIDNAKMFVGKDSSSGGMSCGTLRQDTILYIGIGCSVSVSIGMPWDIPCSSVGIGRDAGTSHSMTKSRQCCPMEFKITWDSAGYWRVLFHEKIRIVLSHRLYNLVYRYMYYMPHVMRAHAHMKGVGTKICRQKKQTMQAFLAVSDVYIKRGY